MIAYGTIVFGVGLCIGVLIGRWRALYVTFGLGALLLARALTDGNGSSEDTPAVVAFYVGCVVALAAVGTAVGVLLRRR
jgi:hypothetical protein